MIYTLTPNPCLDLSGTVDNLVPDEKSYVHDETRSPGGNAINAAKIIHRLGLPVTASGFLGGSIGTEISHYLDRENIHHEFIKIKGDTRINITVSNRKDHHQTRLSFSGPKIKPTERAHLFKYIKKIKQNSLLVLGGSLPPEFTGLHLKQALKIAETRKIATVVDVPGAFLQYAMNTSTLLIKPNLTEFQAFTGKNVTLIQDVIRLALPLTRKIPLICISSVDHGALLVTQQGSWFGKIPPIKIRSTVGAGDSMVGTICAHLWKTSRKTRATLFELAHQTPGDLAEELLRYGLAGACGTLSLPGTHLTTAREIKKYLPKIEIWKI